MIYRSCVGTRDKDPCDNLAHPFGFPSQVDHFFVVLLYCFPSKRDKEELFHQLWQSRPCLEGAGQAAWLGGYQIGSLEFALHSFLNTCEGGKNRRDIAAE